MSLLTLAQFRVVFPAAPNPDAWVAAINAICPRYNINTPLRLAMFLAQYGHESAGFTALVENLNYSANGLAKTWPRRYAADPGAKPLTPNALAISLHRQPERIANNCYANRMGNGDEASGDGWHYRGRGFGITGKSNYRAFASVTGKTLDEVVAYLETPAGALESGCWFWRLNDLNTPADKKDITTVTTRINGGLIGLAERQALFTKLLAILRA